MSSSPSLEILVRDAEGFVVWNGPPFSSNGQPTPKNERVSCSSTKFSLDGSKFMAVKSDGTISIYDSASLREMRSFAVANVTAAEISPCGTYLQTFQKPTTPQEKNVSLWNTETGDLAHGLYQKSITKTTWPSIRFSPDESSACRLATNEVQFFDSKDFSKGITSRIRVPGVAAFELSKTPASHVAVFVPEVKVLFIAWAIILCALSILVQKGSPGSVQIFGCGKEAESQPSARRSFFRCSSVQFSWNHGSTGLLVVVQSDVDKTNKSYYGETKLHYLTVDGTHEGLVPLRLSLSSKAMSSSPSLEILVRDAEGFIVWNGPPFSSNGQPTPKNERVSCSSTKFSLDGSKFMAVKSDGTISIYDSASLGEMRSFAVANVTAAEISPCGTYLQTFQKPTTPQEKNVSLWNTETGDLAHGLYQKSITKTTWPSIRFSPDESSACRLATNEVQFFDPKDFSKGITSRIRVPSVAAFELSKTPASHVAVFVPEVKVLFIAWAIILCALSILVQKGSPGSVQIFGCGKEAESQPSARRSFFRPSIRFSPDESSACRLATNEVQFFDPKDFSKGITSRIRVPSVAAFELSKTPASHVAVFVPEVKVLFIAWAIILCALSILVQKGSPGSVQIFGCGKEAESQPSARRSFFRCSSVQFSWNHGSTGLLVVVQSDVDKTNKSYYGETKLHYLTVDGTHEGLVPLRKEGPVHDVQWSFSGSEFAVVYGFMPACVTIFDKKCKPLMELGEGPYNTLRWNPKGRILCVAGFGNLPGDMTFWDVVSKKQLGSNKAEWSVTSEWSPDGRYFLTASTAPRRQIDNGYVKTSCYNIEFGILSASVGHSSSEQIEWIKIFNYDGKRYFKKMFERLYQVEWKPESPDRFDEISELLKSVESLKLEEGKSQGLSLLFLESETCADCKKAYLVLKRFYSFLGQGSSQKKPVASIPTIQRPAAYRPPHAKQAAAIQAELLGVNPEGEMSKNALRNKKKREKKKAAEAAAASGSNNA
ncbi:hypothetical protein F2Q70_00044639 [Brassica cretica]|uniref:Eukaryotic translation initiation factor 2A n=1 Tax=Brassica cretica TaxID=69181 RepID=A0A8S9KLB9_BRACR|nr:hypothetical protein F2Q70_00044639 [Brassica cretica]